MIHQIEDWSAVTFDTQDLFELAVGNHLVGMVDGSKTLTSSIVAIDKDIVCTKSGSVYKLGEPSTSYRAFMDQKKLLVERIEENSNTTEFMSKDFK